jgi:hypothetical protein
VTATSNRLRPSAGTERPAATTPPARTVGLGSPSTAEHPPPGRRATPRRRATSEHQRAPPLRRSFPNHLHRPAHREHSTLPDTTTAAGKVGPAATEARSTPSTGGPGGRVENVAWPRPPSRGNLRRGDADRVPTVWPMP